MIVSKRFFVYFLLAGCVAYPVVSAADSANKCSSYAEKVVNKAGLAFLNLSTGLLEVPKSMVKTTNDSNVFYGITGGLFKGLVNTMGRMAVGTLDVMTLLIPTKPVVYPLHVWDNFDLDTSYGDIVRFDFCQPGAGAATASVPASTEAAIKPAPLVVPAVPAVPELKANQQQINPKLDTLFKHQMMK